MNLKARIERLEKFQQVKASAQITIDVLDRVVNDTISDEEFARYMPFWEELFSDRTPACETGLAGLANSRVRESR